ncbi:hypothetical protein [Streptomyces sp. PCS3-D2]|uniref:hypothetical protein n=1 Tax=Streptomyces sp. PCS3-D2 TaxID=1460244 RepID=UPI0012FF009A
MSHRNRIEERLGGIDTVAAAGGCGPMSSWWTSASRTWMAWKPHVAPGRWRRSAVITLTTFDLDQYVYAALAVGAAASSLKDVTSELRPPPFAWSVPVMRCPPSPVA